MKLLLFLTIILILSCSDKPQQDSIIKPNRTNKNHNDNNMLGGYKDKIQKSKDMEKEILKAAEKQSKTINGQTKN